MARIQPFEATLKNGLIVTVRSCEVGDALAQDEFMTPMVATAPYILTSPGEEVRTLLQREEWIQNHLSSDKQVCAAVFNQDNMLGLANLRIHPMKKQNHSAEFGMSVHPDFRSQGVGKLLLKGLMDWAGSQPQVEKIMLSVMHDNVAAIGLYRQNGFAIEGVRKRAFKMVDGSFQDEILMAKWIQRGQV